MWVCYVDESGCRGALPSATSNIQPVFVLGALAVPVAALRSLTLDLLHLKRRFYTKALTGHAQFLDSIRFEVKGAEVRKQIATGTRDERRHAIGFTDKVVRLLEDHGARTFARIWVKPIGGEFAGKAVYTSSVQALCTTYQDLLVAERSTGVMIADHVETYCTGRVTSAHMRDYRTIRARYGARVRQLQHRYLDEAGRWRGGVTVSDPDGQRASAELFAPRSSPIAVVASDGA